MKKQHLDPNAKRDFSVLSKEDKEKIKLWLKIRCKMAICPFQSRRGSQCHKCKAVLPEIKKGSSLIIRHPCHVLYVKDVIKIAREAVR